MKLKLKTIHCGLSYAEAILFTMLMATVVLTLASLYFVSMKIMTEDDGVGTDLYQSLATKRMEIILGQKQHMGYTHFRDPCIEVPTLAGCAVPDGYTVESEIIENINTKRKAISVTVLKDAVVKFKLDSAVYEY